MTHHRSLATFVIGALAAIVLAGSLALWDTPARAANQQVSISGAAFSPATLTISVGDKVTWQNNDANLTHTASSDAGVSPAFDTGGISGGATSSAVTFSQAGTFAYHCTIHPGMQATIVVQAAAAATPAVPKTGTGLAADDAGGSSLFLPLFAAGAALVAASGAFAFVAARRR
ncbi:MAG: cupredoxin domain-containing protein [Chloroflexi bacterium]|nr:cupredoxin domain-containing protein [Chloroflexota bacterium]